MDFEQLNLRFGEQTRWYRTSKCGWCDSQLLITEEQYKIKGNICSKCTMKINVIMNNVEKKEERHIKEENHKIRELKEEMDKLGDLLDNEITEEETKSIVEKMEVLWSKIQELKRL